MTSSRVDLSQVLSVCIDAAIRCGDIIREVWESGDFKTQNKGRTYNPFTAADTRSQQLVVAMLQKMWPEINIIGEEKCKEITTDVDPSLDYYLKCPNEFKSIDLNDLCVFVDPLDGTKEFLDGNLEAVLTLIGISYKGQAIAGVMHRPYGQEYFGPRPCCGRPRTPNTELDDNSDKPDDASNNNVKGTTFCGIMGTGAFIVRPDNDDQIIFKELLKPEKHPKRKIVCTTRSHATRFLNSTVDELKPTDVLRVGGAGHKSVILLESRADVYLFPVKGTKLWDTCAPEAIIKSMSGYFTDKDGKDLEYYHDSDVRNFNGFVASFYKDLHTECLEVIKTLSEND